MAKMSDFSNHNIFAYMLASCANLNFHAVRLTGKSRLISNSTSSSAEVVTELYEILELSLS